ncbi:MAG: ABC transporter permease [Lachnospiraceae bacterium]
MVRFILKRLLHLIGVLIGVSMLSFVLANVSSVDPAEALARRISKADDAEMIDRYRDELGFDEPIHQQYFEWLKDVAQLDFGNSYLTGNPAMEEILSALPVTLLISGMAAILILLFGVPLGIVGAAREGGVADQVIMGFSFLSVSVPGYFLGLLFLLIFAVKLKLIPVVGHGDPVTLLLGAFILALPMIGTLARMLRALLIEQESSEYVIYAKARGISKRRVLLNHLLRGAAPTCIVMYGQNLGYLIAGTVVVENIFSVPGLGQYIVNAVLNRDFPVINSYLLLMALFFVFCNMAAEIAARLFNPKLWKES